MADKSAAQFEARVKPGCLAGQALGNMYSGITLERQDLSRTYLAHHELESVVIIYYYLLFIIYSNPTAVLYADKKDKSRHQMPASSIA